MRLFYMKRSTEFFKINFQQSFHLGVDGMITDDLEKIKEELETAQEDPEYSDLLLNKATELFAF